MIFRQEKSNLSVRNYGSVANRAWMVNLVLFITAVIHHEPFKYDIIIWAVRWYGKYGISYHELEDMLSERGVNVDHTTIYRWVQRYAPLIQEKLKCIGVHAQLGVGKLMRRTSK